MKKPVFIFLSFRTSSLPFCLRLFMKNKLDRNIIAVKVHISVIIVIKITSQRIPWKNTWRNTRITGPDLHHGTIAIPALPRPLVVNLSVFSPPFSVTLRLTVLYILSWHMWENIPTYVCQLRLQHSHTFNKIPKKGKGVLTQNWLVGASDMLGMGCKNCWVIATIQWWGCDATAKWDITICPTYFEWI